MQTDIYFEKWGQDPQLSVCSHFLKESVHDQGRMGFKLIDFLDKLSLGTSRK